MGVNNERDSSSNSLIKMLSTVKVGHHTKHIHLAKTGTNRTICGYKDGVLGPVFGQFIHLNSRSHQHHLFGFHELLSEAFKRFPTMLCRPS
jgi:hypothetical protein